MGRDLQYALRNSARNSRLPQAGRIGQVRLCDRCRASVACPQGARVSGGSLGCSRLEQVGSAVPVQNGTFATNSDRRAVSFLQSQRCCKSGARCAGYGPTLTQWPENVFAHSFTRARSSVVRMPSAFRLSMSRPQSAQVERTANFQCSGCVGGVRSNVGASQVRAARSPCIDPSQWRRCGRQGLADYTPPSHLDIYPLP